VINSTNEETLERTPEQVISCLFSNKEEEEEEENI